MRPLSVSRNDRIAPSTGKGKGKARKGDSVMVIELRGALIEFWVGCRQRIDRFLGLFRRSGGKKGGARRRPPSRLQRSVRRLGIGSSVGIVLFMLGLWIWHSGFLGRVAAEIETAAAAAMTSAGLTVQQGELVGRDLAPRQDLARAVGLKRGDPILFVDVDEIRERLEGMGWIKSATVVRELPTTVRVTIDERVPLARWQRDQRTVLIDADGEEITSRGLDRFKHLPRVVGGGAELQAAGLLDLLAAEPRLFAMVRHATLIRQRRWDIGLEGGITVRLPEQDIPAAWRRLAKIDRKQRLLRRDLVAVDLRYGDRLVVRLTPKAAQARRELDRQT